MRATLVWILALGLSGCVFVGNTAYIANYDTPRRDNVDANGKTALDGIGASIAQITP